MTRLRGLYAITSEAVCESPSRLTAAVEQALAGGARLVQYRDKRNAPSARQGNARAILALCRASGALLIINDDADLAASMGADGVHIGQGDAPIERVRAMMGRDAIIGVSCGNSLQRAQAMAAQGADYVAFGRFFTSRTKPDAPPADLAVLSQARSQLSIPVCAIGGITPDKVPTLIAAGANLVAAVDGVFGAADIRRAAAAYAEHFP